LIPILPTSVAMS